MYSGRGRRLRGSTSEAADERVVFVMTLWLVGTRTSFLVRLLENAGVEGVKADTDAALARAMAPATKGEKRTISKVFFSNEVKELRLTVTS